MSDQNDKKQQKLNIQIDDDVAQGIYSNLAIINHSQTEFVLDFVNIMPGAPKNKVRSRIILTPQHAKRLMRALSDNISRFEKSQGSIKEQDKTNIPLNFGGPTGEA
ncbi:DUF3467 domain-containing protein [Psychroflexus gondwanensis]|jgi:uncharacterized protein (DUF1778 family)|uniref:DUF3467 domain-containing protein n=1 Tax=Psychroflexus gondwanensis ACAM 44 TaxID=1189619 RepID=N1WUQ4_9FLAO|nr:DUF3467 domain-containing protein [Psychroflexus gondwanensis]EMY80854.1 hypothetical protein pgond44_09846 [Psychroflexus gondwanensis ACAM 44]TXE21504.1 DUF3467 domain-containing protein [Psychroflexus gondwanensis]